MKANKKTLVLGASENPARYSHLAIKSLRQHGHEVIAVGNKAGNVDDTAIQKGQPDIKNLDTVTLYLSQKNQKQY